MEDETNVYTRQGYGQRLGIGMCPALLIVDFTNAFADKNLLGGGNINSAIDNTAPLLAAARDNGIPIVYSTHAYATDGSNYGLLTEKNQTLKQLIVDSPITAVTEKLAPRPGELVLVKRHPSVFFATDLAGWLAAKRIDTVIISGCTTSGCIRASVVDALGHGLRPIVVRQCVGDRALAPHEANLFDMEQKYADVVSLEIVLQQLGKVR
jgi:maleamate amidohydrolase